MTQISLMKYQNVIFSLQISKYHIFFTKLAVDDSNILNEILEYHIFFIKLAADDSAALKSPLI